MRGTSLADFDVAGNLTTLQVLFLHRSFILYPRTTCPITRHFLTNPKYSAGPVSDDDRLEADQSAVDELRYGGEGDDGE